MKGVFCTGHKICFWLGKLEPGSSFWFGFCMSRHVAIFKKMLSFKVVEMNDSMVDTSAGQFFHHAYTVVNQQQTPRIQGRHWGVQD